jgi:hypothetical protein
MPYITHRQYYFLIEQTIVKSGQLLGLTLLIGEDKRGVKKYCCEERRERYIASGADYKTV